MWIFFLRFVFGESGSGLSSCKTATRQPGDLKDLMLHETAVAWLDDRLTVTTPSAAWDEAVDAFGSRLKQACDYINANYDVENLCRKLPQRLLTLRQKEGARLKK